MSQIRIVARIGGPNDSVWRVRSRLARLIACSGGVLSEALAAEGAVVFAKRCELGVEGIVSKRAGSYRSGRCRSWLKTKNPNFVKT